jgi:hypothetical protein
LLGTSHKLNNDFLFYRATPKRRKVFVLHALHGIHNKTGLRTPGANRPYYECLHADPAIRLRNIFLGNNFLIKNEFLECRLCLKITFRAGFPTFCIKDFSPLKLYESLTVSLITKTRIITIFRKPWVPALSCYTEQASALTGKMETFALKPHCGTFV